MESQKSQSWKLVAIQSHPENPGEQIAFIQGPSVCFDFVARECERMTQEEFTKAALIATAAPDLLEALENLVKSYSELSWRKYEEPISNPNLKEAAEVIKKARGL